MNEAFVEDALLVVAFGDTAAARAAWASLGDRIDIEELPFELHGLFPSVAVALRRMGVDSHVLPRFEGVRRRLWALNAVRGRALAGLLARLAEGDVRCHVTGGMAVLLWHGDLGVRPLTEVDVIVDAGGESHALDVAKGDGWELVDARRDGFLMDQRAVVVAKSGQLVTLRWIESSASERCASCGRDAWQPEWMSAPTIGELPISVAPTTEALSFTLIDGPGLPGYLPVRRRLDAVLLISTPGRAIDWSSFVDDVRARHAEPEVLAELRRLVAFDGLVPPDVVDCLSASRAPYYERLSRPVLGLSPVAVGCLRRHRGSGVVRAMAALPGDLAGAWGLPHARSVPGALLRKFAHRIRHRAASGAGP